MRAADDVIIGTGNSGPKIVYSRDKPTQRHCSGLFVSRFAPKTTCGTVSDHIWNVTGFRMKVEPLRTRRDDYTSFYIRCGQQMRVNLLQASLWPKKTLVKPFYD